MRCLILATLFLVAAICGGPIAVGCPGGGCPSDDGPRGGLRGVDPQAMLESVPEDVLLFLRLRDGVALLEAPGGRATATALLAALGAEEAAARWRALAERLGWSAEESLRRLVGRDASLFLRAEPDGSIDWAVLTTVEREDVDRIVKSLRPTLVPGGRYDLPADRLTFAYRKGRLLVAADPRSRLFVELSAPRLPSTRPSRLVAAIAEVLPEDRREKVLGHRLVAVLPSLGAGEGRSLLAADLAEDERVVATLRMTVDREAPSGRCRGVDARAVMELVAGLADDALLVMVDPIVPGDPSDPLIALGLANLLPTTAPSAGALRVIAVGECPSPECSPPGCSMKRPAIAVAYEVGDAAKARSVQDASVRDACVRLGIDPPSGDRRRVELAPALERAIGRHPLLVGCGLHWRVVERERCGWQIYATDGLWLDRVAARLASPHAGVGDADLHDDDDARRPVSAAGRLCGTRVAEHLRTWIAEAGSFVPERPETFAQGIAVLAEIGSRFRCVEWTARRDGASGLELRISARLAPDARR